MAWHIRPRDRDSSSERQRLARNIAHWKAFFKPFVSAADPEDIRNQEARAQLVAQMSKMIAQRPKSGFEKVRKPHAVAFSLAWLLQMLTLL